MFIAQLVLLFASHGQILGDAIYVIAVFFNVLAMSFLVHLDADIADDELVVDSSGL